MPRVPDITPEAALSSGEEYELIVTAASAFDADEFQRRFGIPLTEIGSVGLGPAGVEVHGARVADVASWNHLSR